MFTSLFRGTGLVLTTMPLLALPMMAYVAMSVFSRNDTILGVLTMPSGDRIGLTVGGGLIVFAVLMLILETIKSTATGVRAMMDHVLSVLLLMTGFALMLMVPGFGSLTFALLVLFQLADVVLGTIVGVKTARRDFGFNG